MRSGRRLSRPDAEMADYSKTVNLPKTDFPMKAQLPKREPGTLEFWNSMGLYERMETREGDVYRKLLEKLEEARSALGGQVFDVLGKLQFEGKSLRDLP